MQLAPPISAPKPELKSNPNDETDIDSPLQEKRRPKEEEEDDGEGGDKKPQAKLTFGLNKKQSSTAAARASLEGIFGGEDEGDAVKPKKKLYSLMSSSNSAHIAAAMAVVPTNGKMSNENRKKLVQSLVNSIPSRREELFNWDLKWNYIDKVQHFIIHFIIVCVCVCITLVPGPPQFRLLIIGTLAIPSLFVCVCVLYV